MPPQLIGWIASGVLLLTICSQVLEQWRRESNEGVSPWLFVGQTLASGGFLVYAWLQGDAVFVVTNLLLVASALTGLGIMLRNRGARGDGAARG